MTHRYQRYRIVTKKTPNIIPHPYRFKVKVKRLKLAKLLLKEMIHYRGNLKVVSSRPCVYGVFSGPVGGFLPREHLCVGCLRCTVQYPEMVTISKNPERLSSGDSYFTPDYIDTVIYEAEHGKIPVKGVGYRGKFGGSGWDGMWTDMSEIVRPTRDGIHGREYISLEVDIGGTPQKIQDQASVLRSIPIPIIFDTPPDALLSHFELCKSLLEAASALHTYAILPLGSLQKVKSAVPLIKPSEWKSLEDFEFHPEMLTVTEWDDGLRETFPKAVFIVRVPFESDLLALYKQGARVFHLTCDYHGRGKEEFILDLIRKAHLTFVKAGIRDSVTLIGSGGIILAEHVAKAIICGLDLVAIDTSLLVALQAKFQEGGFILPHFSVEWGKQRLINLCSSWCDQLLEIMGAMGLREIRRMRGEIGRSLCQKDLEDQAFLGITGYGSN